MVWRPASSSVVLIQSVPHCSELAGGARKSLDPRERAEDGDSRPAKRETGVAPPLPNYGLLP